MTEHKPPFLAEYNFRGSRYVTTIGGDSWAEAEQHLKSIGANGRIIGSDVMSVPANSLTLPFARVFVGIYTAVRNALR
jgi:hypothetical protein